MTDKESTTDELVIRAINLNLLAKTKVRVAAPMSITQRQGLTGIPRIRYKRYQPHQAASVKPRRVLSEENHELRKEVTYLRSVLEAVLATSERRGTIQKTLPSSGRNEKLTVLVSRVRSEEEKVMSDEILEKIQVEDPAEKYKCEMETLDKITKDLLKNPGQTKVMIRDFDERLKKQFQYSPNE